MGMKVGFSSPCCIVAELSCNHGGSLKRAHALIDAAARAGADAIKLQTFEPRELAESRGGCNVGAPAPWSEFTLLELYEAAHTPWAWCAELFAHARERAGLDGFSSTFSPAATEFLMGLNVAALKVSAFDSSRFNELTQGFAGLKICSVRPNLLPPRAAEVVLHCPYGYPPQRLELREGLRRVRNREGLYHLMGYSDHSVKRLACASAVAIGAKMIEAHLMLEPSEYDKPPLDVGHSYTPTAFAQMVRDIRLVEAL